MGLFLQVVPTLSDVDQGAGDRYHGGNFYLRGSGFVEGSMTIHFDGRVDPVTSSTIGRRLPDDGGQRHRVPECGAGRRTVRPITVDTLGGTSDPLALTVTALLATAYSGTPSDPAVASANAGQAIRVTGTGLDLTTDVVFPVVNNEGVVSERVVRPVAVNAAGTEIVLLVPVDAVTGSLGIVGDRSASTFPLQIVPVLDSVDVESIDGAGHARVRLRGKGFVEAGGTYHFGTTDLVDINTSFNPIDVFFASGAWTAYFYDVDLSTAAAFGAVSVSTAGGSSLPFSQTVAALTGTALSGSAANPAPASANPGQMVELTGSGLSTALDLVSRYYDNDGNVQRVLLNPSFASPDGTLAQVVVPATSTAPSPCRSSARRSRRACRSCPSSTPPSARAMPPAPAAWASSRATPPSTTSAARC